MIKILFLLALLAMPLAAAHHHVPIQPGAQVGHLCTYNFVFEDENHTYIGTAGHCIGDVGTRALVPEIGEFGTVVYWRNDATNFRDPRNATGPLMDFAMIQIDDDKLADVAPQMRHFGGPTMVADDFSPGRQMYHYGQGLYYHILYHTRPRPGVLVEVYEDGPFRGWFVGNHAILGGDSGSGFVLDDGSALGVVSTVAATFGFQPGDVGGPTVALILEVLADKGFDVSLSTAPFHDPADPAGAGYLAYQMATHCADPWLSSIDDQEQCVRTAYYTYHALTPERPQQAWNGTTQWLVQANPRPEACVLGEWFVTLWERPCDEQVMIMQIPTHFWDTRNGSLELNITWENPDDQLDLYLYDAAGELVASSARESGTHESLSVPEPLPGAHFRVAVVPVRVVEGEFRTHAALVFDEPAPTLEEAAKDKQSPSGVWMALLGLAAVCRRRLRR